MSQTEAPHDTDNRPAVGGPVQRMVRPLAMLLACLGAAACTPAGEATSAVERPPGWQVFTTPGGTYTYLIPVTLEDGTRCVMVAGNAGASGRAITCDWRR